MSSERLFCSECGASNESDAAFCESCGHALHETSTAAPEVHAETAAPARRLSPKLLAVVALVVFAGGAYALRAPITSFIGSRTGDAKAAADSVQLVPVAENLQLSDTAGGGEEIQFEVTPEALARPEVQQAIVQRLAPQAPAPPARTQTRASRTVQSSAALPLPDEPPDFPDFKVPPPSSPTTSTGGAGEATVTRVAAPAPGRIAAGSALSLRSANQVCSDKTTQGARFTAVVEQDVQGSNGATIPRGTTVTFVVDRLKRPTNANEKPEFSVAPESIELAGDRYPIAATVDAVTIKQKSRSVLGALAGAAVAAAATRAAGGDTKQTVAGGVVGGAAGAVIGNQMRGGDGCIERNAAIRITLASDLTMRAM